ncbi:MAG: hypothetical protein RL071_2654 [Pseudomonadota bacterium]|jgi:hypothetical protein
MTQRPDWLVHNVMAVLEQQSYPLAAHDLAAILEVSAVDAAKAAERLVVEERVMAVRLDGTIHFTLPGRPIRPPPRRAQPASSWTARGAPSWDSPHEAPTGAPGGGPARGGVDEVAQLRRRLAEAEARAAVAERRGPDLRAADLERRLEMALRENDELRVTSRALREEMARIKNESQDAGKALMPFLQDLLALCHPDRHDSNERSTRVTRMLLELRRSSGGR